MESPTNHQSAGAIRYTYIKVKIHPLDFCDWRLFVSSEREIDSLQVEESLKNYQREVLRKSKFGIAIDDIGGVRPINNIEQIIDAVILPPQHACTLMFLRHRYK